MLDIPLSGIKKIEEVASNREYISLSQGSVKVGGIPTQIKKYIQELLNTDKTDYYESCWGIKILREKLAHHISTNYNTPVTSEQILPTHGCIGGLSLLFLAILEPGDEVIIPEPAYPAYTILAQTARSKSVFVSMFEPSSSNTDQFNWKLDVEKIKAATTAKTKIIIFSNPCNPTGALVPLETLQELVDWCELKGIYLVIDEAYRTYDFTGTLTSGVTLVNKSDFVISANTFSKNMAMSGWRIGYLVVSKNLIKNLVGVQDALLNCLNNTAQYAALYALDHPELSQNFFNIINHNRTLIMQLVEPLVQAGIFSYKKPDGGIFLFLKTEYAEATDFCLNILNHAKVGLIPGKTFGPSGASFLRLCYARDTAVLEEGVRRIINYLI
ncbi:pyridoxal phosphate-dependent aminotransferase [Candidatus Babeliales bacterium]|nr:pyridoxal phosphate-dependent aminotransferase [Candidatus Babeliales bacterium]